MKIAYVNELPGQEQLAAFIQAYTKECMMLGEAPTDKVSVNGSACVISVYDNQDLIGIGCLHDGLEVHVLPTYRHREVEGNINKLLKAESKYCCSV